MILVLDPGRVAAGLERFNLALLPPLVMLSASTYVAQGIRWHYLLRDIGIRLRLRDTVLINLAGQSITAIAPLGDLTRAAFASSASGTDFGEVAATVTVQELSYTLLLILSALPAILALGYGLAAVLPVAMGIVAIVVILTVSPVFRRIHDVIAYIPLLNRLLPAIDELQMESAVLLHRRDVLALSLIDALRVVLAASSFWVLLEAVDPGHAGWWQAAFAFALSSIGGAISLIPGGAGASEASVAAILIFLGFSHGDAGAVALVERALVTGLSLALGLGAYGMIHRRLHLGGVFQLFSRPSTAAGKMPRAS